MTIEAQPSSPAQTCVIQGGQSGTIGTANVFSVRIKCTSNRAVLGRGPPLDPRREYLWDVYVDAFSAQVDSSGLHSSDSAVDCIMAGGAVQATFTESPDSIGKVVGQISWSGKHGGHVSIEFYVDSDATVAAQSGIKSPNIPLACSANSAHFKNDSYRISGVLNALNGTAPLTSSMPLNTYTRNGAGCAPVGDSCNVRFWFDNSPGLARTTLDLDRLFRAGSVTLPIQGSATSVPSNAGEGTRGGAFTWSGTVSLRIVGPSAP